MISDELYRLAFEYKKKKLWEKVWDSELFAVKLSDGRIGYVSVMGAAGQHCALGLYIGSEGLDSFRAMIRADQILMFPFNFQEQVLQQNCLQCSFESKDELSEEEREEVRQYARANKIRLAGKRAYPQFTKYQKNLCPWYIQTEEEQGLLCQALEAAIAMAGFLEEKMPQDLGMADIEEKEMEVPMLERSGGTYVLTKTLLPAEEPKEQPAPKAGNQIGVAKLKKIRKSGIWECSIIRFPRLVRNEEEEVPFFPFFLLAVNSATGYLLPLPSVRNYEENPEELVDAFIEGLLKQKVCPKEIRARDERTYAFAEDLCRKLGITLSIDEDLEMLDEVEEVLLDRVSRSGEEELEDFVDMLDAILDMEEEQLDNLPQDVLGQLKGLMDQDMLPSEIEEKLQQIFGMLEEREAPASKVISSNIKPMSVDRSFVISVSLGTGCYRHIQISEDSTLFGLHAAILDAFGFMDDHPHAFFMDNAAWSNRDSYYAEGMEGRPTAGYRLSQLNLYKDKQFKYVFDFGDDWRFQCKVLRIVEGSTPEPLVIRTKGEAPSQYGDWEDDDWEDE